MIEGIVFTALRSLTNDRCYVNNFPQEAIGAPATTSPAIASPTWPAIRYQVISSSNVPTICGTDTMDTDDTRVQIDVVAKTYGAMKALCDQVIAALAATDPPCSREGFFTGYDELTKTHQGSIDFVFYASSAAGSPS
jgi:Protein of unknown function (DUF3168)